MKNTTLKRTGYRRIFQMLALLFFLLLMMPMNPQASQSKDVQSILNSYKKGDYAKASRIANKYKNKTANEKKYRNMLSKKAKKAYKKVLKSYKLFDTDKANQQ